MQSVRPSLARVLAGSASLLVLGCPGPAMAQQGTAPASAQSTPPGGSAIDGPAGRLTPPPTVYDAGKPHPAAAPTRAAADLPAPAPAPAPASAQATEPAAPSGDDVVVRGRFVDSGASSATKLDIRVLDTPSSVASYNGNFLKAIETTNVSDLYRYMTGIQRSGNTSYDISFRGFKSSITDRNAIVTDGLPGLSVRFGSPPTVGVDHIELVKGPTSVLYGQGQPGGFINIITKKPKSVAAGEVSVRGVQGVGPYDRQQGGLVSIDVTGPILQDGDTVTARAVAEGGYTRGFRDFSYEEPVYVSPSIAFKPFESTTITLSGEYRYVKTHFDMYLVAPNRDASRIASINTSYQEKPDDLIERGTTGNVFLAQRITSWLKLNAGYRYVDHFDGTTGFDVVGVRAGTELNANPTLQRRARIQDNRRTYSFFDANLTAKADTFGVGHTILLGVSGGTETASLNRVLYYDGATSDGLDVSLYNPAHNEALSPYKFPTYNTGRLTNLSWRYTTQDSFGLYASDLINVFDYVKVLVGARYANERQTLQDLRLPTPPFSRKRDTKWLPQGGLLIEPTRDITLYASYSSSYVPVAAASQDVYGLNPFVPVEAHSYEGGVKANLLNKRLNLTAAYFDIERKNVINTFACPTTLQQLNDGIANGIYAPIPGNAPRTSAGALILATGTCSNQLGGDRSRGFEIEVNAQPVAGLTITGGYSHTKARITTATTSSTFQVGSRVTNAPDDTFNFWARYDFQHETLANLGVGLGVSYIGKRAGLLPTQAVDSRPENGTLPLAAYTTVDAGVYWKVSKVLNLTLKATNLLDARFVESAGFSGDIQLVPGTPRLLTLAARVSF